MNSKILGSLLIIGFTLTLSVSGTIAFLHNEPAEDLITAHCSGGKGLRKEKGNSSPWIARSMTPGETESGRIALDHAGNSPARLLLIHFDITVQGQNSPRSGGMARELIVTSMKYHGKDILPDVRNHLQIDKELTLKKLDERTIGPHVTEELKDVPPPDGPGGQERTFKMTIKFNEEAGNKYQESTVEFGLSFTLL